MYDQNLSHLKLLMVVMVMKMVMVMKTQPNIRSLPSRNVPKKQYFFLGDEEEELMCEFLHANSSRYGTRIHVSIRRKVLTVPQY